MLFATILSAQCTDALVNIVTAKLFKQYPTLESYTTASVSELEEALRQINYNNAKARYLQKTANMLITEFNSEVPSDITALTSLSGVGRKTANVVRGHIFKIPSIVVDTHVKRVSNRLGLTSHQDPEKIEFELMEILPESNWIPFNQQVITHGRQVCTARNPLCKKCTLGSYCKNLKTPFDANAKT